MQSERRNSGFHFVSRDSQLKALGQGLLTHGLCEENKCKLVYGPKGVGKTALLYENINFLKRASHPCLWSFFDSDGQVSSMATFLDHFVSGIDSNWPELQPFVAAFSNVLIDVKAGDTKSVFSKLEGELVDHFLQSEHQENHPELNELTLVIYVDAIDLLGDDSVEVLKCFRNALVGSESFKKRHQFVFSANDKSKAEQMIKQVFLGAERITEVLVPPFVASESGALLEQFDVSASRFEEIHHETAGIPAALLKYCNHYRHLEEKESQDLKTAEELLQNLAVEQQEWLKIGALLEECDSEKMSLFLSPDQSELARNWLCAQSSEFVSLKGDVPTIRKQECDSLKKLQKKENPSKYSKRMKRVKSLNNVRRVIPKYDHRKLMAYLCEFDCFDRALLDEVLGTLTGSRCWDLVENKRVFFSFMGPNVRLSPNSKIIMRLYNQLFPLDGLSELRGKSKALWKKRILAIQEEIVDEGKVIETNETIRQEVVKSIESIDKSILQASEAFSKIKNQQAGTIVQIRKSKTSMLALLMQVIGIVALYVGVLYKDNILVPVLVLATFLLVVGFLMSLKNRGVEKVTRKKIVVHHEEKKKLTKRIEKMKSEKLSLAIRRDHAKKQINESKSRIDDLHELLKQPYLRD